MQSLIQYFTQLNTIRLSLTFSFQTYIQTLNFSCHFVSLFFVLWFDFSVIMCWCGVNTQNMSVAIKYELNSSYGWVVHCFFFFFNKLWKWTIKVAKSCGFLNDDTACKRAWEMFWSALKRYNKISKKKRVTNFLKKCTYGVKKKKFVIK